MAMNITEPAQTEWTSPGVLAPKIYGSLRFRLDYKELNTVTILDSYSLPSMVGCTDSLVGAQVFLTLYEDSGYGRSEIDPSDCEKTAFNSHHRLYQLTRMSLGLKNTTVTVERFMEIILSSF